jgi:16S rRNA C967 or C1407 C5-methylase (RsmB/RsmF family)/NOL1/NOP2/fmu family ribosome biogenesis protein
MFYPDRFLKKMQDLLPGSEYFEFLNALDEMPFTSIRYNTHKCPNKNIYSGIEVPWESNAMYLKDRPVFTIDPYFHSGAYYVQEASSMLTGEVFRQISKQFQIKRILDLSAAPGGKSSHILDQLSENQILIANEPIRNRFPILMDNVKKWGRSNILLTRHFPKQFERIPEFFDLVVVDAPCSGEGMMRKEEQAVAHWSEQNIQQCFLRQKEILFSAIQALKVGGILIYSTCTFNREENEDIGDFLLESGNLEKVGLDIPDNWGFSHREGKKSEVWVAYPHKVKGEGFAIQVFKKTKPQETGNTFYPAMCIKPEKTIPSFLSYFKEPVYKWRDTLYSWPIELTEDMAILLNSITDAYPGLQLGTYKGKDFIPDHALALRVNSHLMFQVQGLDLQSALAYLRGSTNFSEINNENGWYLITYNDLGIGWCKVIQNRINNYYPKPQRIRYL